MMQQVRSFGLAVGLIALSGCTAVLQNFTDPLMSSLADRGPMAVVADNPYLAGTALINQKMSESEAFRGFIDSQGTPQSISVERSWLGPLSISLYYPEKSEYFVAEASGDTWIIRGPGSIGPAVSSGQFASPPPKDRAQKPGRKITPPSPSLPQLAADGRDSTLSPRASANLGALHDDPVIAAIERSRNRNAIPFSSPAPEAATAQSWNALRSASDSTPAETTPRGDLVHYVTDAKESWNILARWYTDDPNNAGAIARINGKKKLMEPSEGDSVIIPSYLLVTTNRLSEEGLRALTTTPNQN